MKALLILLGILKWLGIILLALLVLILLIVFVVMLSPIRYQLAGEKKEEIGGTFGVSWLFGAVKADGSYTPQEQLKLKVKVLWFTLMGGVYLLSMSCTGFEGEEHVVYHRLYNVANITVISNKNTVGIYDMESEVETTLTRG